MFVSLKCTKGGATFWYRNEKRHRETGPAVEYSNGSKFWYQNGRFHRLDGPAIEYTDGERQWYIDNTEYTEEEYNLLISK